MAIARTFVSAGALLAWASASALADSLPPGWSERADGAFVHAPTTTVCPTEIAGLKRINIETGTPPVIAVCNYSDGHDKSGVIRIRSYVPGQGETQLAIDSDAALMRPGSTTVSTGRIPPVHFQQGKPTMIRDIQTVTRGGLLIDCEGTDPWTQPQPDPATLFASMCLRQFLSH